MLLDFYFLDVYIKFSSFYLRRRKKQRQPYDHYGEQCAMHVSIEYSVLNPSHLSVGPGEKFSGRTDNFCCAEEKKTETMI